MTKQFRIILERIALENHTTPDDVYREMQKAINVGFEHPDPRVREFWQQFTYKGARPTPDDLIFDIVQMLEKGNGALPKK